MSAALAPTAAVRRHAAAFVMVTVVIDAMGVGIILPVMPGLIAELTALPVGAAARWGGYLTFAYALMQFAFGTVVGNLSDRFGRRPVLLASLTMLTVDYLIMALAPTIWILLLGRTLAGIFAATHSTAQAYIADVTPPEKRAAGFGLIGAGFGIGFVLGPLIGGLAGEFGTRVPFLAAAGLAFLNVAYGLLVLPESLPRDRRRPFSFVRANPLGTMRQLGRLPTVGWLIAAYFLFETAHWVYPAVWAFYAAEAFGWSSADIGVSLALVGVGFAVVQGWLIRLVLPRLGVARTAGAGLAVNVVALCAIAFATQSWMVYAIIPVVALGAIVSPALTALMSNAVPDDAQGELQGALTSVLAVTMIASPVLMTQLFAAFTAPGAVPHFPGAPFFAAALLIAAAFVPFRIGLARIPAATGEARA